MLPYITEIRNTNLVRSGTSIVNVHMKDREVKNYYREVVVSGALHVLVNL